ncbi:bifunctional 5,10-methylenetetrahydrofolate dehydrogenase/5,10-methenyltetrahydrofolate cyclohydrolase [Paenibacillus sp. sptzw28]|uniref:bifunctional 5,10-methylenetetrahydrofolate dehydrogenase/5,10-methenyltetrahydrofolate cyclohydrolase n=1 Tax=Paenibacillus sp. sptzw28 TaxID=715179 RepID=UPI001C6E829E|nr:bifunctional 5,10-methylenetetrahydrofolate dehydrogenase/5,10-methenyltetrahydrofolate cyclohydrolase [Paenibacillus sp. sptzw28]QYR22608.1 bifunctional 5,10-methylenetetrahydrofolate dehydrogenase/5,10-methenyltetrahydrofolate cyclohydrolase [Paenibacillus sp. sptzw28]
MSMLLTAKPLADQSCSVIKNRVREWQLAGTNPSLAVLMVQGDPASAAYAQAKRRFADKLGIRMELLEFGREVTETRLLGEIRRLNEASDIHGIMLELPLPEGIRAETLCEAIDPLKDVDGITPANKLACLTGGPGLLPATPQSCIRLLRENGFGLQGKHVVLVGRGETVGRPLMNMLLRENATITVCHSHTPDLAVHIKHADIVIAAAGRPGLITPEMVHPQLVVIDAGINEKADGSGIVGDAAHETGRYVHAISPVPGGVGTLTTAILFENVLRAVDLLHSTGRLKQ